MSRVVLSRGNKLYLPHLPLAVTVHFGTVAFPAAFRLWANWARSKTKCNTLTV